MLDLSDKPFSSDVTHKRPNERKTTQAERIYTPTERIQESTERIQ